jgi:hypothetical protein
MKRNEMHESIPLEDIEKLVGGDGGFTGSVLCPCGCGIVTAVVLNANPDGSRAVNVSLITLAHPEAYYTEKARKMRGDRE